MENILKQLKDAGNALLAFRVKILKSLESAPEGNLRINQNGKRTEYYHVVDGGSKNGTYIKKKRHGTDHIPCTEKTL